MTEKATVTLEVTAKITDEFIEFQSEAIGTAFGRWGYKKSDIEKALIELEAYKRIGLTPEQIMSLKGSMNDGWIPVEDRLPEESGYYRVTVKNKELGDITEETAWFAHADDYETDGSEWREIYEFEKVIAWRELDPYKGHEEVR